MAQSLQVVRLSSGESYTIGTATKLSVVDRLGLFDECYAIKSYVLQHPHWTLRYLYIPPRLYHTRGRHATNITE